MDTIFTILGFIALAYVGVEVATAIYIFRNRRTLVPRIFAALRNNLGLSADAMRAVDNQYRLAQNIAAHDELAAANFARLEAKINYIGRHTKFEREELRRRGILTTPAQINTSNRN